MTDEKHIIEINIKALISGYDRKLGKRAEVNQILNYLLSSETDKFLLVQGLPGTGQEEIMQQVFFCMSDEMLKQTKCFEPTAFTRWNHVYYEIRNALQNGYRYFFLKNIAAQNCYQNVASNFAEFVQHYGARIVVYGKNPVAMIFKVHDEEIDEKTEKVCTSYISYKQNNALICADSNSKQEIYLEYLKRGSVLQRDITTDPAKIKEYIDQVSSDIVSGMDSEDEYDHWPEPLPEQYSSKLLANMITNSIYKTVANTSYDCLAYALQQCYGNVALMKAAKKIQERINTILDIPKKDISDEAMEKVLDEIPSEKLITPAEIENRVKKEIFFDRSQVNWAMRCATLQFCNIEATTYNLPQEGKKMVVFQNPGFLHTLAQHIFHTLRKDGTVDDVLSNDSGKANVFWQQCEELLMCRLTTHNLINEIRWMEDTSEHNNRSIKKIVNLKHSFWNIINIIDINGRAKRIAVIPENQVKKISTLSWNDDVCFATRRLCNSADEIVICSPKDALECLGELL